MHLTTQEPTTLSDLLGDEAGIYPRLSQRTQKLLQNIKKMAELPQEILSRHSENFISTELRNENLEAFRIEYLKVYQALELQKSVENEVSIQEKQVQLALLAQIILGEKTTLTENQERVLLSNFKLEATTCLLRAIRLIQGLNSLIPTQDEGEYIYYQLLEADLQQLFPIQTQVDYSTNCCCIARSEESQAWETKDFQTVNKEEAYLLFQCGKEEVVDEKKVEFTGFLDKIQLEIIEKVCKFLTKKDACEKLAYSQKNMEELLDCSMECDIQFFHSKFNSLNYLKHNFSDMVDYFIFCHSMKELEYFGLEHHWLWRYGEGKQNLFRNVGTQDYVVATGDSQDQIENMMTYSIDHMNGVSGCQLASYSKNPYRVIYKYLQVSPPNQVEDSQEHISYSLQNKGDFKEILECTLHINPNYKGKFAMIKQAPTNVMKKMKPALESEQDFYIRSFNFNSDQDFYQCSQEEPMNFYKVAIKQEEMDFQKEKMGFTLDVFENMADNTRSGDVRKLQQDFRSRFKPNATGFSLTKVASSDEEVVMFGNMCQGIVSYQGDKPLKYDDCESNVQYEMELDFRDCFCLLYATCNRVTLTCLQEELKKSWLSKFQESIADFMKSNAEIMENQIKVEYHRQESCNGEEKTETTPKMDTEPWCYPEKPVVIQGEFPLSGDSIGSGNYILLKIELTEAFVQLNLGDFTEDIKKYQRIYHKNPEGCVNDLKQKISKKLEDAILTTMWGKLRGFIPKLFEEAYKKFCENSSFENKTANKVALIESFIQETSKTNQKYQKGKVYQGNPLSILKTILE